MIVRKSLIPLSRFQIGASGSLPKTMLSAPSVARGGESAIRLVADVRGGRVVADLLHDRPRLRAEPLLEPGDELLAVVVVLVEDGDPRLRLRLQEVARVHLALGGVGRDEADRPRVAAVVAAEGGRSGGDEELRHPGLVEEAADGDV